MELALYDPLDGYYASGRASVGKDGDFFTNVSIGPVYGEILAGQFLEMWNLLGRPDDFTLVEQGANDGRLSKDVLEALAHSPLQKVNLTIIEPFPVLQKKQAETLNGFPVRWVSSPNELASFCGVHFSNELFDALPVDLLQTINGTWHSLLVNSRNGTLVFEPSEQPVNTNRLPKRPDGFTTERRVGQRELIHTLSQKMQRGFLLAIDYGMSESELYAAHRGQGTLACYSNHRRDTLPLENPGFKDITAHVDFSSLARDASAEGLNLCGFTDQHHFLVGAATQLLQALDSQQPTPETIKKLRSLRMLLHPETMGVQFKVMLLSKGISTDIGPSGFQYARSATSLLEGIDS